MNFNSLLWIQLLSQNRLESKLDLSHIPESVLVLVPLILEPKSSILSNHISLLDQDVEHYDSEMIFQDWLYNRDNFYVRILHDPNQIEVNNNINMKEVIKGGFHQPPHYLDWAATLTPI